MGGDCVKATAMLLSQFLPVFFFYSTTGELPAIPLGPQGRNIPALLDPQLLPSPTLQPCSPLAQSRPTNLHFESLTLPVVCVSVCTPPDPDARACWANDGRRRSTPRPPPASLDPRLNLPLLTPAARPLGFRPGPCWHYSRPTIRPTPRWCVRAIGAVLPPPPTPSAGGKGRREPGPRP